MLRNQREEYKHYNILKEQQYKRSLEEKEQEYEKLLILNKEEYERSISLKVQEFDNKINFIEQEFDCALGLKEQELCKMRNELEIKSKEISDIKAQLDHMKQTLSWRYTAIFRRIFAKHK